MREKFYFFNSFLGTARELKDPELQAKYLMAIAEYGLEGKESDDPIIRALMNQTKFTLDRSLGLSEQKSEKMKGNKNAEKSFLSMKNNQNRQKQTQTESNRQKQEEEVEVEEENKKEKQKKEKAEGAFASLTVGTYFEELTPGVQKAYVDFLENRKAMWIKNTSQATKQHLNLLKKIGNPKLQIATITKAIGAGWRGLFELTEKEKQMILNSDPPKKEPKPEFDFNTIEPNIRPVFNKTSD